MFSIHTGYWNSVIICIIWITVPGYSLTLVNGTVGEGVLLPCIVTYKDTFLLKDLIVNWQTESDAVVHSFHYGKDQPKYQAHEFQGRTKMFPEEFHKGNLSLFLIKLHKSDAGKYACIVDLNHIQTTWIELIIQERKQNIHIYLLSAIGAALILLIMFIWIFCKRKKQIRQTLDDNTEYLLSKEPIFGFIEHYRQRIKNLYWSSDLLSSCMPRTLLIPEWRTHHLTPLCTVSNAISEKALDAISSEQLFTKDSKNIASRRMLLAGEAGIGKSSLVEGLQKKWALKHQEMIYDCVIHFTFTELKSINMPVSLRQLLISKCKELEPILTQLFEPERLLIIFDGMDDFKIKEKNTFSGTHVDIDYPLPIEDLILSIFSKVLLPNTDILVTSCLTSANLVNTKEYFERTFILKEFSDEEIKEFCTKSCSGDEISQNICQFIEEHNLSSLASIPLLSSALCELSKKRGLVYYKEKLSTRSEMMVSLLKLCLQKVLSCDTNEPCCATEANVPKKLRCIVKKVALLSYDNLVDGKEEIQVQDLYVTCVHTQQLLQELCVFFFKKLPAGNALRYRHASIRDMFAALHCVWEVHNSGGAKECVDCLDFWVSETLSCHQSTFSVLQNIPSKHSVEFHNFISFFMGFMNYKDIDSLTKEKKELNGYEVLILQTCFKNWLSKEPTEAELLKLFHYIYETHNDSVTHHLSSRFTNVNLFDTPLNALDIRAIQYSLEKSKLEMLNLSLCDLRDEKLQCLEDIIRNSKQVILTSNMLTPKSGKTLRNILEHPKCAITELLLPINQLGPIGVQQVWMALKKNTSLETLNLCDNDIQDAGTENMISSLAENKTLKKTILCMNVFTERGIMNITELMKTKENLKVVMKTTEDEEFCSFVQDNFGNFQSNKWKQYPKAWVLHILTLLQNDLKDEDDQSEKVTQLKQNISRIMNVIRCEHYQ
ncbi:NACHT, LRR and PYD domains-containing protein 1 homolog [Pyxicephalus adspersus]|uniref:NACHT, LRR and PYD domains-containing protein 1 homolog n=1 Tax=Pyxicephalus adspersus TaxID=30357 RepID=UPI003B59DE7C